MRDYEELEKRCLGGLGDRTTIRQTVQTLIIERGNEMKTQIRIYKNKNSVTIQQESVLGGIISDTFTTLTLLFLQYVSYTYLGNGLLIQIFIALAIIAIANKILSYEGDISKDEAVKILERDSK